MTITERSREGASMLRWVGACVLLILVASTPVVYGQEGPDTADLNTKAIELSKQGAFLEAIEIWRTLIEREGDQYRYASVLYMNVGRNYQKLENHAQAWWYLDRSIKLSDGRSKKATRWRTEVEANLKPGNVLVELEVLEPGARLIVQEGEKLRGYPLPAMWWFPAGEHALTLRSDKHGLVQRKIKVAADSTTFRLSMKEQPKPGVLVVEPKPAAAKVSVGKEPAVTGRFEGSLPPGKVVVTVEAEGHQSWRGEADVAPGGVTVLRPELIPLRPVEPEGGRISVLSWSLLGAGAAMMVAGGGTMWAASSNLDDLKSEFRDKYPDFDNAPPNSAIREDWNSRVDDEVDPLEYSSYALWGAGALCAGAAGVLIYLDMTTEPAGGNVGVVPVATTAGEYGFSMQFVF